MQWYRKTARQDDAGAQYNVGYIYLNGFGIKKNLSEAVKWYHQAAEKGNDFAQYSLGIMYQYGYGVVKDEDEAAEWYQKAASQGNKDAEKALKTYNRSSLYSIRHACGHDSSKFDRQKKTKI